MTRIRNLTFAVAAASIAVTAFLAVARSGQDQSAIRGGVYDETPTGTTRNEEQPQVAPDQRIIVAQAQPQPPVPRPATPAAPAQAQRQPSQPVQQPVPAQQAQPAPQAQPQDPNGPTLVEMFGEWKLQCFGRPLQRCELQQRRIDARTQATIFWVEIARTPNATDDTITIITPLGMKVLAGITFSIDGQLSQSLQPQTCVQFGCLSQLKANRVIQQKLVQSKQLRATVTNLAGQKVTLEMPSNGLSEGYNRMYAVTNTR